MRVSTSQQHWRNSAQRRRLGKFTAARHDLGAIDGLEFRTLCCAEEMAIRPEFVAALTKEPDRLKRTRWLYGLVNAYFAEWRTMPDPGKLETLLLACLDNHTGKNLVFKKWLGCRQLFSQEGALFLKSAPSERRFSTFFNSTSSDL
jgi:hypothetical protein